MQKKTMEPALKPNRPDTIRDIQDLKKRKKSSPSNAQIHSKIEKRRRDKMNNYISQLTSMIPLCNSSAQKMDKITVLRMTVQYLRSIQNSPMQISSGDNLKGSYISDEEMKRLILQVSEGFVFVIACNTAKIMYISESVTKTLNYNRADLLDRSLYDVIHPLDVDKIKEQISFVEPNLGHQLASKKSTKDLNLKIPSEQLGLYPGSRRSFFFRIKKNIHEPVEALTDEAYTFPNYAETSLSSNTSAEHNQYVTIQCVGYLKSWSSFQENDKAPERGEDFSSLTCLIAVGRKLDNSSHIYQFENPCTFVSKHTVDGKFLFVDHWITIITGYLPQELLSTNIYDYIHSEDVNKFAAAHQSLLQSSNNCSITQIFRFRTKFGTYVDMRSEWKTLINPWKKDVEFFYCKNVVTWTKNINLESVVNAEKYPDNLQENDLFSHNDFSSGESQHNLIMDFNNFHSTVYEKANDEVSLDAILELLECDTNIANSNFL